MWLPLSTVTALCILADVMESNPIEDALEKKFRERSETEWEDIWHEERHNRCREDLSRHMYWACEKDIYRLVRRSSPLAGEEVQEAERYETNLRFPWLRATHARRLVRWRRDGDERGRRKRRSITAECCEPRGCTWEEYAEYCPFKRQLHKSADWS